MKIAFDHHGIKQILVPIVCLFLLPKFINHVGAQSWEGPPPPPPSNLVNLTGRFTPSMAIILFILVGGFLFMGFYSIYIRNCTNRFNNNNNNAPRARSRRALRRGLEPSIIETFPIFSYSEVKDHKIGKGDLECAICLNEFENDETLRLLPKCDHVFHPQCIDAWLESHSTCPVCRADLVPQPGDKPVQIPVFNHEGDNNGEVVVQVDEDERPRVPMMSRNLSFDHAKRLKKSGSIKLFGFNKYRSHSTGHSLVQPGENLDRFTLRLPAQVRKDVMDRATLNRAKSCIVALPSEESSRKGYRGEEGGNRAGRLYQKIEQWSDRRAKSERRNFLTGGFSTKSPDRGVGVDGESTSKVNESRSPNRLPSLKCLDPKTLDDESLSSNDQLANSRVNNI